MERGSHWALKERGHVTPKTVDATCSSVHTVATWTIRTACKVAQYQGACPSPYVCDTLLQERLGPCGKVPTYVVFSGADENVPPGTDKVKLVNRFKQALGPLSSSTIIDGAEHELDGYAEQFTQLVEGFLGNITETPLE